MNNALPEQIVNEEILEELLSRPTAKTVEFMRQIDGDITILGIAGKVGLTLGRMAARAMKEAGLNHKVYGVARFSDPESRAKLEEWGITTIAGDLLDSKFVSTLPETPGVIFMVGRKFGTEGDEAGTWAINTGVPVLVADHYRSSRIVVFSTGCVYAPVTGATGGATEDVTPDPVGEYCQSCLGRERIFEAASNRFGTPVLLFRLNYAIDMRYGVLWDIASKIWAGQPVSRSAGLFNVLWQGDVNNAALQSLVWCESPAKILNVTGPETASVEVVAEQIGRLMGKEVTFEGEESQLSYLNNASHYIRLSGYPTVSLEQMIIWQAEWIKNGGSSLGKPTHFEVSNGKY